MKPHAIYLKVAALGSSLLLLTAFVAWQSGAFAGYLEKEIPPQPAVAEEPAPSEEGKKTFFVGSKSTPLGGVPIATPPASAAKKPPTMIGGTKRIIITPPPSPGNLPPTTPTTPRPDTANPPPSTTAPEATPPKFLPGSKAPVHQPPPKQQTAPPQRNP